MVFLFCYMVNNMLQKFSSIIKKYATSPYLSDEGLDLKTLKRNEALMLYKIDSSKNTSKFYECLIKKDKKSGRYSVLCKWGRLTDKMSGSRVDGTEKHGLTLEEALREVDKISRKKRKGGYVNAWGPEHVNPKNKQPLVPGEYPIGLSNTNYGWGKQRISENVGELKKLDGKVKRLMSKMKDKQKFTYEDINKVLSATKDLLKDMPESTAATNLMKKIDRVMRRSKGDNRFSPDPDDSKLLNDLKEIKDYLDHQLSYQ